MKPDTEHYEYIKGAIASFLKREQSIHASNLEVMYDNSSWFCNFFNTSFIKLRYDEVRLAVDKLFKDDVDGSAFNAPLARVRALYSEICMACGMEYIDAITDSAISSLDAMDGTRNKSKESFYRKAFTEHPELIIAIIGSADFSELRIMYNRKRAASRVTGTS